MELIVFAMNSSRSRRRLSFICSYWLSASVFALSVVASAIRLISLYSFRSIFGSSVASRVAPLSIS
ncbi:MAG: hypothetical protein APR56_01655, partial [Methanosaeta sp. SDB]